MSSMYTIVVALFIAILFRSFAFEPFRIPSASMYPTLKVNDFVMVAKYSYGFSRHSLPWSMPLIKDRIFFTPPQRGDIIVFKLPDNPKRFFVKRLIGVPGDKIQLEHGKLKINGQFLDRQDKGMLPAEEKYVDYYKYVHQYEETMPNGSPTYTVWNLDSVVDKQSFPNTTREYVIPKNYYFFMGDNRDNSIDSRYINEIGLVHGDNLLGKALLIHLSFNNIKRTFKVLR